MAAQRAGTDAFRAQLFRGLATVGDYDAHIAQGDDRLVHYIRDKLPTRDELDKSGLADRLQSTLEERKVCKKDRKCTVPGFTQGVLGCTLCPALVAAITEIFDFANNRQLPANLSKLQRVVSCQEDGACYYPGAMLDLVTPLVVTARVGDPQQVGMLVCVSTFEPSTMTRNCPGVSATTEGFVAQIDATLRNSSLIVDCVKVSDTRQGDDGPGRGAPWRVEYSLRVAVCDGAAGTLVQRRLVYYVNEDYTSFVPPEICDHKVRAPPR